jgi:hypothetical protein
VASCHDGSRFSGYTIALNFLNCQLIKMYHEAVHTPIHCTVSNCVKELDVAVLFELDY